MRREASLIVAGIFLCVEAVCCGVDGGGSENDSLVESAGLESELAMGAMGGSVDRMEEAKSALPFLETGMDRDGR